ncbi:MAG TPA: N-succinylarginine dihydrolase, partial [Fibrobacteria bacterium]|nr:N-succinylarginine dihydrolase [Fibrobacteria bacterium]
HTRLAPSHGEAGLEVFVHGHEALRPGIAGPRRYLPRQSREASEAVARLHGLAPARAVFLRQSPAAIDAGVFHNDVIAVGNGSVLFCHEKAYVDQAASLKALRRRYAALGRGPLTVIEAPSRRVRLADAVSTYLFNSQLVTLPSGDMLLLAAAECEENPRTRRYLEDLIGEGGPITRVEYADLRQSMRNGGGPACLRLRVPLTVPEWTAVPKGIKLDEALHARLADWVNRRYRDRMLPGDLADPSLPEESRAALDELTGILGLGPIYPFQA